MPRSLAALVEAGRRPGEKKLRVGLDGAAVVGAGGQVLHGAGSVLVCVNDVNSGLASDASVTVPLGAASAAAGGGLVQRRGGRVGLDGAAVVGAGGQVLHGAGSVLVCVNDVNSGLASDASVTVPLGAASAAAGGGLVQRRGGRVGLDGAAVVGAGGQVLHGAGSVLVCVNDVNSGLASDASVTVPLGAASAAAGGGLVQRRGGRVGLDGAAVVGAGGQVLHGAGSVLVCVNDVNSGLASDASVTVPFGAASAAAGGGLVQRRGGRVGLDGAAVVGAGGQVLHGAGSVLVCVNDVNSGLASDASVTVPFGAASAAAGGGLVQRRGGRVGLDGAAVVGAGGQVLHGAGSVLVCVNDVNSGLASDASVTVPLGAASTAAGGGLVQRRGGRVGLDGAAVVGAGGQVLHGAGSVLVCVNDVNSGLASDASVTVPLGAASAAAGGGLVQRRGGRVGLDGAAVVGAGGQVLHGAGSVLVCVNDVNSGLASDASVTVPFGAASAAAGGGLVQRRGGRVGLDGAAVVGAGGQVLHGAGSVLVCVNDVNSGLASDASVTVPLGAASAAAGGGLVQRRGGRVGLAAASAAAGGGLVQRRGGRVGLDGAAVVGAGGQVLHGAGSVLVCVNDVNSGLASDASVTVPLGAASAAAGGGLVQRRGGRVGLDGGPLACCWCWRTGAAWGGQRAGLCERCELGLGL